VFLTPYLQPYSEVASGYSPGNCASRVRIQAEEAGTAAAPATGRSDRGR